MTQAVVGIQNRATGRWLTVGSAAGAPVTAQTECGPAQWWDVRLLAPDGAGTFVVFSRSQPLWCLVGPPGKAVSTYVPAEVPVRWWPEVVGGGWLRFPATQPVPQQPMMEEVLDDSHAVRTAPRTDAAAQQWRMVNLVLDGAA